MSKIIVVDDDPTNATLTKLLLELDGFAVLAFSDVPQAIEAATPDIRAFVVDIHLARGASGLDLVRAIRAGKTGAAPNAVVVTASGDQRRESEARDAGADYFLLKPYSPSDLSMEIRRLLAGSESNG